MGTGIDGQVGFGEETVYGTPVVVTRFFEFLNESLDNAIDRQESQGLRAGSRVQRSGRWTPGKQDVKGDIDFELANKGYGLLLKHMFGGVATTTPGGGTLTRDHTFTPADLTALSLTVQKGLPPVAAAVTPMTYHGCKVSEWEISCAVDEIPKLKVSLLGEEEDQSVGLATPSYPASVRAFPSTAISLSMAGTELCVTEVSLQGNNGLAEDRFCLGSVRRKNPLEQGMREYTGKFEAEFENLTQYNRFINGTEAALVITMLGDVIEGALRYQLVFTCNVRVDGETPKIQGPEILTASVPFKCLNTGAGDGTAITVVYRTTDVTP
jgi:hypothetical protein